MEGGTQSPLIGRPEEKLRQYEGRETGLIMTLIRREREMPKGKCEDSAYIEHGKKVVRHLKVFKLHREGTNNFYINKDGYKVFFRTSEHGPYVPP